jgi:hypothetical protein
MSKPKKKGLKIGLDAGKLYDVKDKGTITVLNLAKFNQVNSISPI